MKSLCWLGMLVVVGSLPLFAEDKAKKETLGTIERLDPAFDDEQA